MTLLPETLCIGGTQGRESDGTFGRDPDRYLGIIIDDRSSQDRTRGGGSWEERRARDLRDEIAIHFSDLDRANRA